MHSSLATAALPPARVGVVGCGGWSQGWHLPQLRRRADATIVALVDTEQQPGEGGCTPALCESMEELSAKYGAPVYTSVESLLSDASVELDGVLVAVPHAAHQRVGEAVLRAGLHLLMEKPLTADVDEAVALAKLARERPSQASHTAPTPPSPAPLLFLLSSPHHSASPLLSS